MVTLVGIFALISSGGIGGMQFKHGMPYDQENANDGATAIYAVFPENSQVIQENNRGRPAVLRH